MPTATSPEAQAYGRSTARKLLVGRTGHGGGPCMSRVLREADLIALTAIAFDAGMKAARVSA